jgi:hypothetical protein
VRRLRTWRAWVRRLRQRVRRLRRLRLRLRLRRLLYLDRTSPDLLGGGRWGSLSGSLLSQHPITLPVLTRRSVPRPAGNRHDNADWATHVSDQRAPLSLERHCEASPASPWAVRAVLRAGAHAPLLYGGSQQRGATATIRSLDQLASFAARRASASASVFHRIAY